MFRLRDKKNNFQICKRSYLEECSIPILGKYDFPIWFDSIKFFGPVIFARTIKGEYYYTSL